MNGSSKGSTFEREICVMLSRWWTGNARSDIFWRTAGSGARAKVRGRKSQQTEGQHGDIGATDPIGADLIKYFMIELKRGYSRCSIMDMIDKPAGGARQPWEAWLHQIIESHEQSNSARWLLIHKKNRKDALAFFPHGVLSDLRGYYDSPPVIRPHAVLSFRSAHRNHRIHCVKLSSLLSIIDRDAILFALREFRKRGG